MRYLIVIACLLCSGLSYGNTTYDEVIKGKECGEDSSQQIVCRYKINDDFDVEIIGVGQRDTAILFNNVNFEASFYAKFGISHQCLMVHRKEMFLDMAFISPRNGKVYLDWRKCEKDL